MRRVEKYLIEKISHEGCIHIALLDPEKTEPLKAAQIAKALKDYGSAAIMIGGSTAISVLQLDEVVKEIKKEVKIPVILFPNNVMGISKYADAMWFMSLLNSGNPLFITGMQALGAPLVKRYGLETLPLGYIIVNGASAAAYIGHARAIPREKPEIVASYALAAQYLGMRFVYLEAGSGAREHIPLDMISSVKKAIDIPLIVGGGIRKRADAERVVKAGADIIVTGTLVEERVRRIANIIKGIKETGQPK